MEDNFMIPERCWKQIEVFIEYNMGRFWSDWIYENKRYIFISRGYHNWSCEVLDLGA